MQPGETVDSEMIVADHTLTEWREILQSLDPKSPASERYIPGLIALVGHRDVPWFTRRQAALTLGRIGEPAKAAVPVFLKLLDHDEPDRETTRLWTAKALALIGTHATPATSRLAEIALSNEESYPLRATALEALSRIGADAPQVIPTFIEILNLSEETDSDVNRRMVLQLRIAAAEGLSLLGPAAAQAIPALLTAQRSESSLLRLPCVTTLGAIGPAAEIAVPTLADALLFDEAPEVADAAAKSLGQVGPASLPVLTQFLNDEDEEVRLRAVWGLTKMGLRGEATLKPALDDSSTLVAAWSAAGLIEAKSQFAPEAAVKMLNLLGDPDRQVRIKAYRTLQKSPNLLKDHQQILADLSLHGQRDTARAAAGLLVHLKLYLEQQELEANP